MKDWEEQSQMLNYRTIPQLGRKSSSSVHVLIAYGLFLFYSVYIITPRFAWPGKESSVISGTLCWFLQQLVFYKVLVLSIALGSNIEAFSLNLDDLFMIQKFILLWHSEGFAHVSNVMIHVLNIFLEILEVFVT